MRFPPNWLRLALLHCIVFPMWALQAHGQGQGDCKHLDLEFTVAYKTFLDKRFTDEGLVSDSIGTTFYRGIQGALNAPSTLSCPFDSLSKHLSIQTSEDKRIRFYSWDNLDGGSYHTFTCMAQFLNDDNTVQVQHVSEAETDLYGEDIDVSIYAVHDIEIQGRRYYLTFGWGTYGGGMQHKMVQIFSIEGGKLTNCRGCFASKESLFIEYPRAMRLELKYDPLLSELTYQMFTDPYMGESRPTGEKVTLFLRSDGIGE